MFRSHFVSRKRGAAAGTKGRTKERTLAMSVSQWVIHSKRKQKSPAQRTAIDRHVACSVNNIEHGPEVGFRSRTVYGSNILNCVFFELNNPPKPRPRRQCISAGETSVVACSGITHRGHLLIEESLPLGEAANTPAAVAAGPTAQCSVCLLEFGRPIGG